MSESDDVSSVRNSHDSDITFFGLFGDADFVVCEVSDLLDFGKFAFVSGEKVILFQVNTLNVRYVIIESKRFLSASKSDVVDEHSVVIS